MWLFYMRLLSWLSQMQLQPCFCKLKWVCLTFLPSHICAVKQRKKIVLIVCKKVTAVEKGATAASRLHLLLYCIVKKIPVNFKFGSFALNWSSRANEMPQRKAMKSLPVLLAQKFCKTSKTWFYKLPAAIFPIFYQKRINNVLNFIRSWNL